MSILNSLTAWLPHPVYRFHGGPADGEEREVKLVETQAGMVPMPIWKVPGPWEGKGAERFYQVHVYRFVAAPRQINIGHYEYVPG